MTTTKLHIAPGFALPLDAVTETFAILAVKRAGKSNAAVVMAEQMYDAGIPWVAIDPKGDWWGVRAAGDGQAPGLSVLVLGGMHSDIPLEPAAGKLVANLIVEQRITCVLDVSEMTKADQRRFLTDFAGELYRKNTEPLHVFCEEADEYIPQRVMGESAKLVGAFETLVKRGGFRGIGITLITQRSASLNKDVLTQAGTLIAMRTPSPQDRKAVLAWIDHHAASRDVIDELPTLEAGEAWVFSPQWLRVLTKIRFHRRRTFDSGATPKVGGKPRPPARLADVDLAAIKEQMAETIERQKADDPKELRARIRALEAELVAERKKPAPAPVEVPVETPVLDPAVAAQIEDLLQPAGALLCEVQETLLKYRLWTEHKMNPTTPANERGVRTGEATRGRSSAAPSASTRPGELVTPGVPTARPAAARKETRPTTAAGTTGDAQLKAGARRILETLARHHPMRVTRAQLGTLAKFKVTGGTFTTYWGALKRAGYVDESAGDIGITAEGLDYIGVTPGNPQTTEELLEQWRTALKAGARKMLDELVSVYPAELPREYLAERVNMEVTGGTFGTYLGTLRRNGLVTVDGSSVRAAHVLFLGGA